MVLRQYYTTSMKQQEFQRKLKAMQLVMQALKLTGQVTKPYKLVNLDACDIKPDTQLEWRTQGHDSYCNEFTNYEIKE